MDERNFKNTEILKMWNFMDERNFKNTEILKMWNFNVEFENGRGFEKLWFLKMDGVLDKRTEFLKMDSLY